MPMGKSVPAPQGKSDKLLKSLGVVCKTSPSGEPECLGIFRRQTLGLRPRVCLQKIPRLQTLPRVKFFQTTPAAFQQFVPHLLQVCNRDYEIKEMQNYGHGDFHYS